MIWLLTIKHTGTHYLFAGLKQMGLSQATLNIGSGDIEYPERDFVHAHIDEVSHQAFDRAKSPVIVTMRNPVEVYKSWVKRNCKPVLLFEAFAAWDRVVEKFVPFIFRVDDTKCYFPELAKFLNIDIDKSIFVTAKDQNQEAAPFTGKVPIEIVNLAAQYGY